MECSAILRPLPNKEGVSEVQNLHVCFRHEKEPSPSFTSTVDRLIVCYALHQAGAYVHDKKHAECSYIVVSPDFLPELIEETQGKKMYRWKDGQVWIASRGCVDKQVRNIFTTIT